MTRQTATANPYEIVFRLRSGALETVEVYAYTAQDSLASAVYALVARHGGAETEGIDVVSIAPPRRCWSQDWRECSAINRLLADIDGGRDGD